MQNIIQLFGVWKAPVNVDYDYLPDQLHMAYDVVPPAELGDKDDGISYSLRSKLTCPKLQLYYLHKNPSPRRVRVFLYLCHRKPDLQVLRPHPLCPPRTNLDEAPQEPFNFILSQDPVHHINQLYHYGYWVI